MVSTLALACSTLPRLQNVQRPAAADSRQILASARAADVCRCRFCLLPQARLLHCVVDSCHCNFLTQVFEALVSGLQCPMCIDNGSTSKVKLAPSSDDFVTLYGTSPKAAKSTGAPHKLAGVKNTAHLAYGSPKQSWVHSGNAAKADPYPRHY